MNGRPVIPRVALDDPTLRPQTRAHHVERYAFAAARLSGVVLDLMCGTGYGTEMLREAGCEAIGIDADKDAIAKAKDLYPRNVFFQFRAQDIFMEGLSGITWFEGIEHISPEDGHSIIERCATMLPDGGLLFVSTPRDLNEKYNPWHMSAWPLDVLVSAASQWFSEVETYGQDWDTAKIEEGAVVEDDFYILVCRR